MEPLRDSDPVTIGGYTLRARLGIGGMGRVYLAHTTSGRLIAIKVINDDIANDPRFRDRFAREVDALRTVGGFWAPAVHDADPRAGTPWLATEYVPGASLQRAVADTGVLPLATVKAIGARLAEALAAIHQAGLVHRDLKPSNVLLAADGPKVIDFGISRPFLTDTAASTSAIGTPSYMAPEQVRGERLSPASDVFALGSTLVYALVGRGPFDIGPGDGVLYRVAFEDPYLHGVHPELRGLIAACLARHPADRPTTAAVLDELGPPARAITAPYGDWCPPPVPDPPRPSYPSAMSPPVPPAEEPVSNAAVAAVPPPAPTTAIDAAPPDAETSGRPPPARPVLARGRSRARLVGAAAGSAGVGALLAWWYLAGGGGATEFRFWYLVSPYAAIGALLFAVVKLVELGDRLVIDGHGIRVRSTGATVTLAWSTIREALVVDGRGGSGGPSAPNDVDGGLRDPVLAVRLHQQEPSLPRFAKYDRHIDGYVLCDLTLLGARPEDVRAAINASSVPYGLPPG